MAITALPAMKRTRRVERTQRETVCFRKMVLEATGQRGREDGDI